jgi:hypothetical protein
MYHEKINKGYSPYVLRSAYLVLVYLLVSLFCFGSNPEGYGTGWRLPNTNTGIFLCVYPCSIERRILVQTSSHFNLQKLFPIEHNAGSNRLVHNIWTGSRMVSAYPYSRCDWSLFRLCVSPKWDLGFNFGSRTMEFALHFTPSPRIVGKTFSLQLEQVGSISYPRGVKITLVFLRLY